MSCRLAGDFCSAYLWPSLVVAVEALVANEIRTSNVESDMKSELSLNKKTVFTLYANLLNQM